MSVNQSSSRTGTSPICPSPVKNRTVSSNLESEVRSSVAISSLALAW